MSELPINASVKKKKFLYHILVIEDLNGRRVVSLDSNFYSLGRSKTNSIVIQSPQVSRVHATLLRVKKLETNDECFWIIDGDLQQKPSTNGLIINQKKYSAKQIQHEDLIYFAPEITAQYYQITDIESFPNLYKDCSSLGIHSKNHYFTDSFPTLVPADNNSESLSEAALVRLASFPELFPYPIFEINLEEKLTYLNSAAIVKFPHLQEYRKYHPLIAGLVLLFENQVQNSLSREVQVGDDFFEQYIHFLPENAIIRSYIFDITKRKQIESLLQYHAYSDFLTGLPNRNYFSDRLLSSIINADENQAHLAVMFIDIDHFKSINDSLGHAVGDKLLTNVARRLTRCVRENDLVARWAGDEFTILLQNITSYQDVDLIAQRILDTFKRPFKLNPVEEYTTPILLKTSLSIGIAVYPFDGEDKDTLLKNADVALYKAKHNGRNSYKFYNQEVSSQTSPFFSIKSEFQQAFENEEFLIYYQPQINTITGEITEVEALVRWQHEQLGLIHPKDFLAAAEETGLITTLGQWVLYNACKQNKAWQEAGLLPLKMAVNFSQQEFYQPNLITILEKVLSETGLSPKYLNLEIKETSLMQNSEQATAMMSSLQALGIEITIDDFGTGYSSLSYLSKFPYHQVKIAQSCVHDLFSSDRDTAMISALIAVGRSLNLKVVAEGVETIEQMELLCNLQCEEMQGYFFTPPLTAELTTKLLQNNQMRQEVN